MADSNGINLGYGIVLGLMAPLGVFAIIMILLLIGGHLRNWYFGYEGGAKRKRGLKVKSNTLCCLVALVAGSLVVLRLVRGEGLL